MILIASGRRSGKTYQLVKYSSETGIPIMTANKAMARNVKQVADHFGLIIPEPVVFSRHRKEGLPRRRYAFDEIQIALDSLTGSEFEVGTIDADSFDFEDWAKANTALSDLSFLELNRRWISEKMAKKRSVIT